MAGFINFKAIAADENQENVVVGNVDHDEELSDIDSLDSFIDDES